jgi:hypothetical protein
MSLEAIKQHLEDALDDVEDLLAPTPPPTDINVGPGDNLLDTLAQAPEGAVISIDPTFAAEIGTITLRKPVILQARGNVAPGRAKREQAMPTLLGSLTFQAPHIGVIGLCLKGIGSTILTTGPSTLVDRCVLLGRGTKSQHRGIMANSVDVAILGSYIGDIWHDIDTQAIGCNSGTKRLIVRDCLLEASGENFMAGGADPASADLIPEDILIEDCTLSKHVAWRDRSDIGNKNLFELKNAKRVTLRRCLLEYSWADAQSGFAIVLTPRNQNNRAPFSTVEDILLEDLTIRHVGAGISMLGRDDINTSEVMRRVTVRRVTVEDMSRAWAEGGSAARARALQISAGPQNIIIEDCDFAQQPGILNAAIGFAGYQTPASGLELRRCRLHEGSYGIIGEVPNQPLGEAQIAGHAPGYIWEQMTIVKGASGRNIRYPAGTTVVPA